MNYIILPHEGADWLHSISSQETKPIVNPLVRIETDVSVKYILDEKTSRLAKMDQEGKRFTVYKLLHTDPWMESILPPVTLPCGCRGKSMVLFKDTLYVAVQGRSGDLLLFRSINPDDPDQWKNAACPEGFSSNQYSINGIGIYQNELYVNYLSEDPRINLKSVYDLADPGSPVFTRFFSISRFDKYHILEAQDPHGSYIVEFLVEHSCDSDNVHANLRIIDLANMTCVFKPQ